MSRHPIEQQSYAIMRGQIATSHLPPLTRAVIERVVHASADLDYVGDLVCHEATLEQATHALNRGAQIVTDVEMVAAGITARTALCQVRAPAASELAARHNITRSAAGIRLAFDQVGHGAIWVIGNAPTALYELLRLDVAPALVVGLPVGFVGATESKQALRESGLPAISNRSAKGGSAVAAAAVNALLYLQSAENEQP